MKDSSKKNSGLTISKLSHNNENNQKNNNRLAPKSSIREYQSRDNKYKQIELQPEKKSPLLDLIRTMRLQYGVLGNAVDKYNANSMTHDVSNKLEIEESQNYDVTGDLTQIKPIRNF